MSNDIKLACANCRWHIEHYATLTLDTPEFTLEHPMPYCKAVQSDGFYYGCVGCDYQPLPEAQLKLKDEEATFIANWLAEKLRLLAPSKCPDLSSRVVCPHPNEPPGDHCISCWVEAAKHYYRHSKSVGDNTQ